MSSDARCCDRCGARLGRGSVRVEVLPSGDDGGGEALAVDACKECGRSLGRWLERGGRFRAGGVRKTKAPEARKSSRRHGRFRPSREQMALAAVIILCALFCVYFYRGSAAE